MRKLVEKTRIEELSKTVKDQKEGCENVKLIIGQLKKTTAVLLEKLGEAKRKA